MNLKFLVFGLLCFSVEAAKPQQMKFQLMSETTTGTKKIWKLERDKEGHKLNGLMLKPERIVNNPQAIKVLGTTVRIPLKNCYGGTYRYQVFSNGKKSRTEHGCLSSERFLSLKSAFDSIGGTL
ncbi:MAG: hypothetical protein ACLGG0_06815 [Bacteriovoracia bacterium]